MLRMPWKTRKQHRGGALTLIGACKKGYVKHVNKLLKEGANPNELYKGALPLITAIILQNDDIVKLLLEFGADPNLQDQNKKYPLDEAIQLELTTIVKLLLEKGANPNIMVYEESPEDEEEEDEGEKVSLLYIAILKKNVEIVKLLLEYGADVNVFSYNMSPLAIAAEDGEEEIVKLLLEKGADPNLDEFPPLFLAINSDSETIVKMIIDYNANVNAISNGVSALIIATEHKDLDMVKLLLEKGANPNLGTRRGLTSLYIASKDGQIEIVKLLLEKGAIIDDKTILEIENFSPEIIALLKKNIPKGELWKGWTRSDSEKLDTIFSDDTANDYACCPFCLKYVERSEACMYMSHNCSELGGYYHKKLYDFFANNEGKVYWCTICGRHCIGHKHYQLSDYSNPKKEIMKDELGLVLEGNPFEKDCRLTNGGGGLPEKLARFRRLREFALELQDYNDTILEKNALNQLIEETWNAPLQRKPQLKQILLKKEWNIPHSKFKPNMVVEKAKEEENAPNIQRPEPNASNVNLKPLIFSSGTNTLFGDENVEVIQFRHRKENGEINTHERDRISKENLSGFIENAVKNFGEASFGYCYMYPECTARLYPSELQGLIPQELYEEYKKKFNKKFKGNPEVIVVRGGGSGSFFTEAANAQCVMVGGKRLFRKTRKNNKKKQRKTRVKSKRNYLK